MRSVVLAVVVAGGCIDTPPLAEPVVESSHVEIKEAPEGRPPPLDVLIVVDDTTAMAPYRDRVATMPVALAKTLHSLARGWADLRIAVATNDGRLRRLPGVDDPFLVSAFDLDYTHRTNFQGSLDDALAQLMDVGAASDGPNQPLEAIRSSLETSSQFLREPAAFSVVMISASDDASPLPVPDYVDWMERVTRGVWWRPFSLSLIYNAPAARLDTYFADRALRTPLDGGDYARAFSAIGGWAGGDWGVPCLDTEPLDRDPTTPELEPDCALSLSLGGELRPLAECGPQALPVDRLAETTVATEPPAPCWELVEDRQNCGFFATNRNGYELRLRGYTDRIHPAFRFECRTQ